MTEGIGLPPEWVARKVVAYDELRSASGSLWWLQSDPDHGGCRRVMRADRSGSAVAVTPPDVSVGGQLHAYGGGAFTVTSEGVWFVGDDGSLLRQAAGRVPERIDSVVGSAQYGDLAPAPGGGLLAVRGDDTADEIIAVSRAGHTRVLVRSREFLGSPRLAAGTLAYVEWQREQMPWDSTRLVLADIRSDTVGPTRVVAGGPGESVVQPSWGPDGLLYFMSDRTGRWNLYRLRNDVVEAVAPTEADCAPAPWEGGYQSYGFTGDGTVVLTVMDGFATELLAVDTEDRRRRLGSNLTSVKPYVTVDGSLLAVVGSTASSPPAIWSVDLSARADAQAFPVGEASEFPVPWKPVPPSVETIAGPGEPVRFLLHLPPGDTRPAPLLVRAHPGPTDDVPLRLDWVTQYFVSHGFIVAEVLYRGSTGQGRAFRQSLHGHWGSYDVDDCAAVAEHLLTIGQATPGAVFVSGASAGGYTALQAACRPGPFTAATAISAIIDPGRWELSVPAFQRPHAAALRGPAGAVKPERVRCPVLVIHGSADTITSAEEAMRFADELAGRGGDHGSLLLEGGDHYLSAPLAREQALRAELDFYRRIMSRLPA
ncbi:S9 family peptidase [Kitasatospora sp. NPDC059648]|uniref:S9 family peptidase n=1 Tax=Kitasatospora sp. NPDC059648 TaxID=3346894 RepID=UPI0036C22E89